MVQLHNATLLSSRGNYAATAHLKDRFFIKQRSNEPLYFSEQVCSWGKLIDTSKVVVIRMRAALSLPVIQINPKFADGTRHAEILRVDNDHSSQSARGSNLVPSSSREEQKRPENEVATAIFTSLCLPSHLLCQFHKIALFTMP